MFEDFRTRVDDTSLAYDEGRDSQKSGLTPRQRFVVALLMLVMTAAIGVLLLLFNAKIVPPFWG